MADPLCKDESSEDGSTSYSDFCDDDMIKSAKITLPDATQSHDSESSPPSSYSSQDVVLGKRKALDGAEGPVTGPFYSYKKRSLSDTDSLIASTLDYSHHSDETLCATQSTQSVEDTPTPYIIVGSVKIGPLRYH